MQSFIQYDDYEPKAEVQEVLNKNSVRLGANQWKQFQMNSVCLHIKQWSAKEYQMHTISNSMMIKQIQHISFTQLTLINISQNNIQSIQSIHHLQVPNLENIYLWGNDIHTIRMLKKCYWTKLDELSLHANKINQGTDLWKMGAKKQQKLNIQYSGDQCQQSPDLRWIFKLQTFSLKSITRRSDKRMRQSLHSKALNQKYTSLNDQHQ